MPRNRYLFFAFFAFFVSSTNTHAQSFSTTKYRIALILPFHSLDKPTAISEAMLDFMEGFKMGVNDMEKMGMKLELHVMDCSKDSNALYRALRHPDMRKMNVIVGPVYDQNLDTAYKFCKANNIVLVSPLKYYMPDKSDSLVINFFTPDSMRVSAIGAFAARRFPNHTFYIATDNSKKSMQYAKWIMGSLSKRKIMKASFLPLDKNGVPKLKSKKDSVIIICTVEEKAQKENLASVLENRKNSYLIAHVDWHNSNRSVFEVNEPKIIYSDINFVNSKDTATVSFRDRFFDTYWGEPSKYAYLGYDQATYLSYQLMTFGKTFNKHLPDADYRGIISVIHLSQTKRGIVNLGLNYLQIIEEQRVEFEP